MQRRGRGRVFSEYFLFFWILIADRYPSRFVPRFFEKDMSRGYSELTPEGRAAVEEELKEGTSFCIEGSEGAKLAS
jgi:hypothetical protein